VAANVSRAAARSVEIEDGSRSRHEKSGKEKNQGRKVRDKMKLAKMFNA
jgi:hypothetical protein